MLQKTSTLKIHQSHRQTNTPYVVKLDIGLDTPRFPGHDVACSTTVVVTADVSTLTDTLSFSSAVTSQSRGVHRVDDVTHSPPEISWLFIAPNGDVVDRLQTGSGIKVDPGGQASESTVFRVSENTSSNQTAQVAAVDATTTANFSDQYRTETTNRTSEYLTVATNTARRSVLNDSQNAATVACSTVMWPYINTTTHVDCTVMTGSQSVATNSFILRRANSMPASTELLTGANQGTRTSEQRQVMSAVTTNIPHSNTSATTYQFDNEQERVDYHHDNGHVVSRERVPAITQQLCRYCQTAIDEPNSLDQTDVTDNQLTNARAQGLTATDVIQVTCHDQAVGNDDDTYPAVECGVGDGTVWTESRGTGERTVRVWTADAQTCTPTVSLVDRSSGSASVHLVHKNEATDNQQTVSVGTSPAEDITSAYRGLLAAILPRPITVSRGTATTRAPLTADRETLTEHGQLVDCGTSPSVDVAAAYRARVMTSPRVTVSRGTLTVHSPTRSVDKDTITDCTMVDRASSPIKV